MSDNDVPRKRRESSGLPPPAVHHLAVAVTDLAAAERFYSTILGLPVVQRWEDEGGRPRAIWLALGGGAFLAVERAGGAGSVAPGGKRTDDAAGWHCIALRIDVGAREGWRLRLAEAGHPVERETAYTIYFRDPDGTLVAMSHHPHPAPPRAG